MIRLVSDRRDESLEVGYRAMLETPVIAKRVDFAFEEFKRRCEPLEVLGFFGNEPVGMVLLEGNHPHIAILKKYQGRCGKVIKEALDLLLKKSGILIADVYYENDKAIRFVERLGFKYKKRSGDMLIYKLGDENVFQ